MSIIAPISSTQPLTTPVVRYSDVASFKLLDPDENGTEGYRCDGDTMIHTVQMCGDVSR